MMEAVQILHMEIPAMNKCNAASPVGLHGVGRLVTLCTCTTCADAAEQLAHCYMLQVLSMSCGQASQVLQP